jgi:hypothetical protein
LDFLFETNKVDFVLSKLYIYNKLICIVYYNKIVLKKFLIFTIIVALFSFENAFNQQVYRLSINQPPPLTITISEEINATVGEVFNLDTWFHVEGDISYDRIWKFWDGSLLQTIDNPVFTVTSDGVFYLTVINEKGCTALDSIAINIITGLDDKLSDDDNRNYIHVYPNPNTGTFDITISDCQPGFSIEIINSLGVQLFNRMLDCNNNEFSERIVMPYRKSGTYYLLVKKGGKIIYRQKVIILN